MSVEASRQDLPFVAPCRRIPASAPLRWIALGWRDFTAAPLPSMTYGLAIALLGMAITTLAWRYGSNWVVLLLLPQLAKALATSPVRQVLPSRAAAQAAAVPAWPGRVLVGCPLWPGRLALPRGRRVVLVRLRHPPARAVHPQRRKRLEKGPKAPRVRPPRKLGQ